MAKAYVEARREHGESELLDEIVAAKPERDHTRYHSVEELKQHGLLHLRDAVELLERKATAEEVEDYKRFVVTLADRVANAHREGGETISDAEGAAIEEISESRQGRPVVAFEPHNQRHHAPPDEQTKLLLAAEGVRGAVVSAGGGRRGRG